MAEAETVASLAAATRAMCRHETGDADASVRDFRRLGGHAGFGFGFTCDSRGEAMALALRLPPPGVKLEGTADVLRQGDVLRAVAGAVPVPSVRWSGADPRWYGRPYLVTELVGGASLPVLPDGRTAPEGVGWRHAGREAVAALASLHGVEWQRALPTWGPPRSVQEDIASWERLLERAGDPGLMRGAAELRDDLLARVPSRLPTGLCHGDFQWTNLLFAGDRLAAVLDWELAGVGCVLNDAGWLVMFSDASAWAPGFLDTRDLAAPADLEAMYLAAARPPVEDLAFFRALAAYKFAVIAGFNLGLHRRGRHVDAFWETLAPSIPHLIAHGRDCVS